MRFWDSSAVVLLLVEQDGSAALRETLRQDPSMVAWWATPVECVSALARLEREGALTGPQLTQALARLDRLSEAWQQVEAGPALQVLARRLLRTHPLRAADALQLAAALVAADGEPGRLPFVCLDERLRLAADKEGLARSPTP